MNTGRHLPVLTCKTCGGTSKLWMLTGTFRAGVFDGARRSSCCCFNSASRRSCCWSCSLINCCFSWVRDVGVAVLKVGVLFKNGNKTVQPSSFIQHFYMRQAIGFSAIFHWHHLTFSCRCVLTGVGHKHLSIYTMAQKSLNTPLHTGDLQCRAPLVTPAYLFQYNQGRHNLQWGSKLPIRGMNEHG